MKNTISVIALCAAILGLAGCVMFRSLSDGRVETCRVVLVNGFPVVVDQQTVNPEGKTLPGLNSDWKFVWGSTLPWQAPTPTASATSTPMASPQPTSVGSYFGSIVNAHNSQPQPPPQPPKQVEQPRPTPHLSQPAPTPYIPPQ